jgi:predicted Co/Zn/Cd cation transporter (cation efflux family)
MSVRVHANLCASLSLGLTVVIDAVLERYVDAVVLAVACSNIIHVPCDRSKRKNK